jgi:Na+-translocating ferredoxin:NAD+ oxidoreductase RnfG subunit
MVALLRKFHAVFFITILIFITAFLLVITDDVTREKLKAKQDKQIVEMLEGIFPEASFYTVENDIYTIYNDGRNEIGYAFYAAGKGCGGEIVVFVGLKNMETIQGIVVISHKERRLSGLESTVGLDFTPLVAQFVGLRIDDCYLVKKGGQVDGVSGATISSTALVDIVRNAALEKVALIG